MKPMIKYTTLLMILFTTSACANRQMFWDVDDKSGSQPSIFGTKSTPVAENRAPLELPPELRADIELPMANAVSSNSSNEAVSEKYRQAVTGKKVALDARVYDAAADQTFSAVVDAMTSLSMPVDSVDSASGIVTTDWIRKGAYNNNLIGNLIGSSGKLTRHRYVVRVFRVKNEQQPQSRLEVRTLLQGYTNGHWVNTAMNKKHAEAFFVTVEEQLGRLQGNKAAP